MDDYNLSLEEIRAGEYPILNGRYYLLPSAGFIINNNCGYNLP